MSSENEERIKRWTRLSRQMAAFNPPKSPSPLVAPIGTKREQLITLTKIKMTSRYSYPGKERRQNGSSVFESFCILSGYGLKAI
jgi:hypothetical protein